MPQLSFCHLQKLFLGTYSVFSSLGSHVDFPEYILMAVFYKFIRNLELPIKDREKYSSNLGKDLRGEGWEDHFEVNLRSEHGTITRTGITCKKIPCYMRDSACRWLIVEKAKILRSYVKHFWIFPRERNCGILIGLYK